MLSAMFVKSDVDLSGAKDDSVNLFRWSDVVGLVGWIGDDPLEVGVTREIFNGRTGERVA